MFILKRTIQWFIGIICGLLLILQICVHIPFVQEWTGRTLASALNSALGWDITIGRVKLGLANRVIIDNITLNDEQDSLLLHASRLAAKIDILPFFEDRISISNAQLFGTQINAYQSSPNGEPNFMFAIKSFSSEDSTNKPINLHIGNILLRRVDLNWDKQWIPCKEEEKLDPNHLRLRDITLTAHLRTLRTDSLNFTLKRFSFHDQSGLTLENVRFSTIANREGGQINDFLLQLPNSTLSIPLISADWSSTIDQGIKEWFKSIEWQGKADIRFTPSDIKGIVPELENADTKIHLSLTPYGKEGGISIPDFKLTYNNCLNFTSNIQIKGLTDQPECLIDITKLQAHAGLQQLITQELQGIATEVSPIITRLDTTTLSGKINISKRQQSAHFRIRNHLIDLNVDADARDWNSFSANISSPKILLGKLLTEERKHSQDKTSLDLKVNGELRDKNGERNIEWHIAIPKLTTQDLEYNNINVSGKFHKKTLSLMADISGEDGKVHGEITLTTSASKHISGYILADHFPSKHLGIEKFYPDANISLNSNIELTGSTLDNIKGNIAINDYITRNNVNDSTIDCLDSIIINTNLTDFGSRTLSISSTPFNLSARGHFRFSTLGTTIQNILHKKLPELVSYKKTNLPADTINLNASIQDTTLLSRFIQTKLSIPQEANLHGIILGYDSISIIANIPRLYIKKEELKNCTMNIEGDSKELTSGIFAERKHKHGFVDYSMKVSARNNRLRIRAGLDNNRTPRVAGEMDISTIFSTDPRGQRQIKAWVAPTDIIISDTVWRIHPTNIAWDSEAISISNFKINQNQNRGIEINGIISNDDTDTLLVKLHRINIEYILNLVNFKSVEFSGLATGSAIATQLLSNPKLSAGIRVDDFRFNKAPLGTLRAEAIWGATPHFLTLDANIADYQNNHFSTITGGFNIGNKEVKDGLDLRVDTKRFNLAFLNLFTKGIFDDFQGRASGYCRIFGPFKAIDLEGEMKLDYADCRLPMLGTAYHIQNDSVHLHPGEINIKARLIDERLPKGTNLPEMNWQEASKFGFTNTTPHTGVLNGTLRHNHFKNLTYDFSVQANRLLGYDFKHFGDNSFYATCIATGDVGLRGIPGRLTVDINVMPEEGTTFTYNVSTPDALTEAKFITINSREGDTSQFRASSKEDTISHSTPASMDMATSRRHDGSSMVTPSSDLFLNFNLQLTPDARLKLLMDRKSGDMIELMGRGRITAKYYNKGRFNIYGTYRIQEGSYNLSIQDIIRKDFKFQPDGTIVFGGNAMKADLNLKAVYSVNSVSLDDLATSSLGFSKTRVDCIMNLTGRPEQPVITFDFDLPDATEDERQMVRSIVSTEEERNMQAIYLLGLGRFYRFETNDSEQGSIAMNSLVSSTLSSQLNQFLSSAVGSNDWNFGTSLKTGEDGWRNMDVEGLLSGSLFDDRLLLTGNFGYREKYYTQRNFISDVTIEYLLTKSGSISLKAYNLANDRYFVQSSLNTQGIGIQLKKDFNRFSELFHWLIPQKRNN